MKWLAAILRYAPEVVALGKDVRELVESKKTSKRVLVWLTGQVGRVESDAAIARMHLELRLDDLEERLESLETHA